MLGATSALAAALLVAAERLLAAFVDDEEAFHQRFRYPPTD
jgi:hypothetical protein